jgi:Ca2+/Na+ antiporter
MEDNHYMHSKKSFKFKKINMQELNKELLIYLNSLLDYQIIERITLIFADIPIFFLPIFLVIAWLYYTFSTKRHSKNKSDKNSLSHSNECQNQLIVNKKKDLLFIFYSCVIAVVINLIIKNFVQIDRPETVLE